MLDCSQATTIPRITSEFNSLDDVALGGLFTDMARLAWRFCFWINLPFDGIAVAIILFLYKPASAGIDLGMKIWPRLLKLGISSVFILTGTITCLLLDIFYTNARNLPTIHSNQFHLHLSIANSYDGTDVLPSILLPSSPSYIRKRVWCANTTSGITIAIATLVSGTFITIIGSYVPFMWAGAAIFTVGCYLLHTLVRSSTMKVWFAYQVIVGIDYGFPVQILYLAMQVVIVSVDRPLGNASVSLFQALGGALGLSIAENVSDITH
ncbi:hypothetical protein PISL3812_04476 [Talaromyces islandicus]|uniref:Uncharacterized protein n=1 Tax=Talaromyces islandicus TaxID=28573 RepID=A0A0U1LVM0_TALIS|nr:hypothetical protein PISL3812_04476 [Talaromyces islandicus]